MGSARRKLSSRAVELVQGKNFASIATSMPDGSPQVTPVWIDSEGDSYILVNVDERRVKAKNIARDPRVALCVYDQKDPYHMASIRGRVVETIVGGEAEGHIDKLAKKYLGKDEYPFREAGTSRILYRIEPEREYVQ